jgi:hypothetical protein
MIVLVLLAILITTSFIPSKESKMADVLWLNDGNSPLISAKEQLLMRREKHSIFGTPEIHTTLEVDASKVNAFITRMLKSYQRWPYNDFDYGQGGPNFSYKITDAIVRYQEGTVGIEDGAEVIRYSETALIDVIYTALPGIVIKKDPPADIWYYHEEDLEPYYEGIPSNYHELVWGTTDGSTPTAPADPIHPDESPNLTLGNFVLTRKIRGYAGLSLGTLALLQTVNSTPYTSAHDGKVYPDGTLLLTSLSCPRMCNDYNYSYAVPTIIAKWRYRKDGWNKFLRTGYYSGSYYTGWYDIRYNKYLYEIFEPFPEANHSALLF